MYAKKNAYRVLVGKREEKKPPASPRLTRGLQSGVLSNLFSNL